MPECDYRRVYPRESLPAGLVLPHEVGRPRGATSLLGLLQRLRNNQVAELAWFGTGVTNAKATPDASVDPTATYRDAEFDCSMESQIYTVTIDDGTGAITNNTVELLRGTP